MSILLNRLEFTYSMIANASFMSVVQVKGCPFGFVRTQLIDWGGGGTASRGLAFVVSVKMAS